MFHRQAGVGLALVLVLTAGLAGAFTLEWINYEGRKLVQ